MSDEPARHFDVDLTGLIRVFGGHLYSSPEVFVRELVQNAVDALAERRRIDVDFAPRIVVRVDPEAGTVEVEDNGTGLDERGLEQYLSRIGSSSKRTDAGAPREDLVGQFGIGLLAGFLVAERLEVETRAAHAPSGLRWIARVDGSYAIEPTERTTVGTLVRVPLAPSHAGYARPDVLRDLLVRYCAYLRETIVFAPRGGPEETLTRPAPWSSDDRGAWKAWLEARGERPRFVVPLAVGSARGFAWVHERPAQLGGARCDLYLKGMLLKHGARDVLPEWAGFCSAVLEAPSLAPTASREDAVRDDAFVAMQAGVREALLAWLGALPERDPDGFDEFLRVHHLYVKGACLESDALLTALGDRLPFETNFGLTNLARHLESFPGAVLRYVDTPQEFAHVAPLASAQGVGLINASYVYDAAFLAAFARRWGLTVARVDASSVEVFVRDAEPRERERYAHVLREGQAVLDEFEVALDVGRFAPGELPAFLVTDAAELRERAGAMLRRAANPLTRALMAGLPIARERTRTRFVLNLENPLVAGLPDAPRDVLGRVVRLLYAQSALVLRRSLSVQESRVFSHDLLAILMSSVRPDREPPRRGGLN